jgi:hypothetical protein
VSLGVVDFAFFGEEGADDVVEFWVAGWVLAEFAGPSVEEGMSVLHARLYSSSIAGGCVLLCDSTHELLLARLILGERAQ